MKRTAFTLIELSVVILILAIVAAVVTLNLKGPMSQARFQDVRIEIDGFLAFTRATAVRTGRPVELVLDADANRLIQISTDAAGHERRRELKLPARFRLRRVLMRDGAKSGRVTIRLTRQGLSDAYVLVLGDEERPKVLLVSGMGGQMTVCEDVAEAEHILQSLATLPTAD